MSPHAVPRELHARVCHTVPYRAIPCHTMPYTSMDAVHWGEFQWSAFGCEDLVGPWQMPEVSSGWGVCSSHPMESLGVTLGTLAGAGLATK